MPRTGLAPIPLGTPIVERDGTITTFFRQRWQDVSDGWGQTASAQRVRLLDLTASVPATTLLTVVTAGLYRLSWYLRITRPDPVSASVHVGYAFTDLDGTALGTYDDPPLTSNSISSCRSFTGLIRCLAPSDIIIIADYVSNTPGALRYDLEVSVEFLP
jgi:hypothetical protein